MPPIRGGDQMNDYPNRKWPRLRGYDYSSEGFYFLTICTEGKKCLLSTVVQTENSAAVVKLSKYGEIAESYLLSMEGIDKYVIMPNHIHLILHKTNGKPVASDIRSFKGLVTKKLGKSIWQDYYFDHVIRDKEDYLTKWNYIENNPAKWIDDEYHP